MIDFSNNINFLGPPAGYEKLNKAADLLKYADYKQLLSREIVAEKYHLHVDNIALSVGATEAISIVSRLFQGKGAGLSPSFWEYEYFHTLNNGNNSFLKIPLMATENFKFSTDLFDEMVKATPIKVFYLANPNNPTTVLIDKVILLNLVKTHPSVFFVVDETYLPFSLEYEQYSLFKDVTHVPNLAVITSMSKIFALPGVRLGLCVAHVDFMQSFRKLLLPYGVSHMSQLYFNWLMQQDAYLFLTRKKYAEQTLAFKQLLSSKLGEKIQLFSSSAPYLLFKLLEKANGVDSFLEKAGLMVRSGKEFDLLDESWARISIRSSTINKKLVNKLCEFLFTN